VDKHSLNGHLARTIAKNYSLEPPIGLPCSICIDGVHLFHAVGELSSARASAAGWVGQSANGHRACQQRHKSTTDRLEYGIVHCSTRGSTSMSAKR